MSKADPFTLQVARHIKYVKDLQIFPSQEIREER